jgi:hypothetical protein
MLASEVISILKVVVDRGKCAEDTLRVRDFECSAGGCFERDVEAEELENALVLDEISECVNSKFASKHSSGISKK